MTRISKASMRDLSAAFSFVRYLLRFSRCAMYSVAFERTVAFLSSGKVSWEGEEETYLVQLMRRRQTL
jgi:hypothetical protein